MQGPLESFYAGSSTAVPAIEGSRGHVKDTAIDLPRQEIYTDTIPPDVRQRLGEKICRLYASLEAVTVKVKGRPYTFEIGSLPGNGDDTELRVSTYSSSLSDNPGNAFELAGWADDNPDRSYVYVASPGNGLSSPISSAERKYLRRYGRLLYEEDSKTLGLPVVEALGLALKERGHDVTRLGSNSAGALLTTAYGATHGEGAITATHQNVRPNLFDRGPIMLAYGMLWRDARVISPWHSRRSPDVLKMSHGWLEFTKSRMGQAFEPKTFAQKAPMAWANLWGLGKGPGRGDPLLRDTEALLRSNPSANVLFTVGRDDPLVESSKVQGRLEFLCRELSRLTLGHVRAVIIDDSGHGPHTFYPQFVRALARASLG